MNVFLTSVIGSVTFGAIVSIVIWIARGMQARRDLTLAVHQEFHTSDFYANVRAPAYKVILKWGFLPTQERDAYRRVVSSGWSQELASATARTSILDIPSNCSEYFEFHFKKPAGEDSLTEHQALVALLRFWTRLNIYRKNGCINTGLARKLLCDEFSYVEPVFLELAEAVSLTIQKDQTAPSWIKDIYELEKYFSTRNA